MEVQPEAEVQAKIQIEGPMHGCILMRNNSGAFTDESGRVVFFGLGNISKKHSDNIKSSDLIGFRRVTITPQMVGQTVAIFTAVEVKRSDWKPSKTCKREKAQMAFISWIQACGGVAGFANSVDSFKRLLG